MRRAWWVEVLRQAKPPLRAVAGVVLLIIASAGIDALRPWPMKWLIDRILTAHAAKPLGPATAVLPGAASVSGAIAYLAISTVLLFLAGQLARTVQNYLQNGLGVRANYALGARLFDQLQNLSLLFHTKRSNADLVRRITTDASCVSDLLLSVLFPILTSITTLGLMLVVMWRLDAELAGVAMLVAVPLGILVRVLYGPISRRSDQQQAAQSEQMVMAERMLGSVATIQLFGHEEENLSQYRASTGVVVASSMRTIVAQLLFKIGTGTVTALGTAIVMLVGGFHVLHGRLTLGSLLVFISYLASLYAPLEALAYVSTAFASAGASGRRVMEILDSNERVHERPGARRLPKRGAGESLEIRFEDVTFGYEPGRAVLRGINLQVPPGKTVALVGRSGAGKSTLVSLVPRLMDPWEGRVVLDGHDVCELTLASLREQLTIVPQEPLLLPLSIRDNIAYGRRGASDAEIEAAAEAAQLGEFISQLPRGYHTVLGDRGCTLSAGQRQRVAIARALLRDAPILLLDEPTSALDVDSERLVIEGLRRLTCDRTSLIVTHRLSTVKHADLIAVMEDGQIIEFGPPSTLLQEQGAFARLYDLQLGPQRDRAESLAQSARG